MTMQSPIRAATATSKRRMSIRAALAWAFGREHARVEFDELSETSGAARMAVDPIWLMMQRGALGCKIDGGGSSDPHWDAEVIASAVANLPLEWGGRSMAATIANLARSGRAPDWMPHARSLIVPVEMTCNRYGWTGKTEDSRYHPGGWQPQVRRGRKVRIGHEPVLFCPVRVVNTASQIAAARRRYLDWIGALYCIHADLRATGILATIELDEEFPPLAPWRADDMRDHGHD